MYGVGYICKDLSTTSTTKQITMKPVMSVG